MILPILRVQYTLNRKQFGRAGPQVQPHNPGRLQLELSQRDLLKVTRSHRQVHGEKIRLLKDYVSPEIVC